MKKIGMIGGFGPESTLDYYRLIIETYMKKTNGENYPEIIIYSMDINKLMKLVDNKEWGTLVEWLIDGIILGCTELPLIFTKSEFGVPFFNTTKIHVDSIVKYYLNICKSNTY